TSMGNNNGSAFAGFAADTTFTNMVGAVMMLLARFIPLVAALYLAQNMAGKSSVAASSGTLSTKNGMFIGLLIGVVVLVGALSFLPALALGPIADFFTTFK
ncbi:potassium-transporting ATPase subunit KdpA, partial [Listeria monocytogenes]|nr:potassium-transporting ATPase subunit KdpA [Listeria monocytogenes]